MPTPDIRSYQRFQNFKRAFLFFEETVNKGSYSRIEVGGLVQAFEFTFELGWKTIKDFLYEQGVITNYPRDTIQHAFQSNIIEDGHMWITMLDKRNELSHTYNEEIAEQATELIRHSYYPAITQVYEFFNEKFNE